MNFKFNHGGETIVIPLSDSQPSGKRLAIYHDSTTYYAPFASTDSDNASAFKVTFDGGSYALSADSTQPSALPEMRVKFNNVLPVSATAATVLSQYADFGVIADENSAEGYNVTLSNGTTFYKSVSTVIASQENTTIFGNANNDSITLIGGKENFVVPGLKADKIYFDKGGGLLVCGASNATKSGAAKALANSTTQQSTSSYYAYDRFDVGSYQAGADALYFNGTVTAVYCDTSSGNTAKRMPTADFVITYTDTDDEEQVVLLKDVTKTGRTFNSSVASSRIWHLPSVEAGNSYWYEGATQTGGGTRFSSSTYLPSLVADFNDFPVSLRPTLIRLYNMYNSSPYHNSRENDGLYTQALPDWVPQRT